MDIGLYRARIGLFHCARHRPRVLQPLHHLAFNTMPLSTSVGFVIAIMLLLSGNVELNPGPVDRTPPRARDNTTHTSNYRPGDMDMDTHVSVMGQKDATYMEFDFSVPTETKPMDKLDELLFEIRGVSHKVDGIKSDFDSWKSDVDKKIVIMDKSQQKLQQENSQLKDTVANLQHQVNELENSSRSNNLIISGIVVGVGQPVIDSVRMFLVDVLKLADAQRIMISAAFTLKDKRILAKFASQNDRNRILDVAKTKPASTPWRVKPDICRAWHETRKMMAPIYQKKVQAGHKVLVRQDYLIIDNVRYDYDPTTEDVRVHQPPSSSGGSR